ncbi:MAG: replication initiation factor domain-containing protein [Methylotenera sp.]|uniref:replication initiation factor domain-containing protein n=1 Tax=Methylotenera sp. TaxID=2051956 RepID=UPI00272F7AD0|nr:replication initiation factor domain-containing protein [Methylotenera sp.]MDP1522832.1 replication initiation factor domain-containing protein [Methylotenera sp.]
MKKIDNFNQAELRTILDNASLSAADFALIAANQNNGLYIDKGRLKKTLVKRNVKTEIAHIDWLNFTFQESTITHLNNDCLTDFDIIVELSKQLFIIFDLCITSVRPNGANFYDRSFEIGDGYGLVCHGGQNNTILVSLNAQSFQHMSEGWQNRLYAWLENTADLPGITRIDLAHDSFEPSFFTVDNMLTEFKKGSFNNGNRSPSVSQAGNWVTPDDKGRTLYIGKRTNGLFCRIYEKGLQLSSVDFPRWVRVECEIKAVDRIIPNDILLTPHIYLAGAYPVLNVLNEVQSKIKTIANEIKSDINHRVKWGKRQNGSLIKLLQELDMTNDEIIEALKADKLPRKFVQRYIKSDLPSVQSKQSKDHVSDFDKFLDETTKTTPKHRASNKQYRIQSDFNGKPIQDTVQILDDSLMHKMTTKEGVKNDW